MALTPEQEKAIASYRARTGRGPLEADPQKFRTLLQGTTFNTADEAEAAIVSAATGRPKQEVAQEIRAKIANYRAQSPDEAQFIELAGAVAPSLILSAVTKSPAPMAGVFSKFFPNLAKVAGLGALEGGVQTIGAMEEPVGERFEQPGRIATGAGMGALFAGGIQTAGLAGLKAADVLSEAMRFASGSRARNAANAEIQRIAEEAGIDAAEAERMLLNGELVAENPDVALAIRPLIGSGEASTVLRGEMRDRPTQTRATAMQTIRSGIARGLDRNIYRHMRASNDLLRKLENDAYKDAWRSVQDAPQSVVDQMYETIARFPNAGQQLKNAFKSETGKDPFFVVDDKGVISFRMLPTMKDAEQLRRIVADESRRLVRGGGADATIGINLGASERNLRGVIDEASPGIGAARESARLIRARNENYQNGKKAASLNADQVEVEFADVLATKNPALIQAYRLGYLESLNAKMEGGNKASMVARMTNPETKEGRIFRTIYPGDIQDAALARLGVASQAETASRTLFSGSSTAPTQQAAQRIGMISQGVSTAGLAADALRGDARAAAGILDRMIDQFRPGLTDAQKAQVARVLTSRDPNVVKRALMDREALKSLQSGIIQLADVPMMTAALAGTTLAPQE